MKSKITSSNLAKMFGISEARAAEAVLKAKLISAIISEVEKKGYTHQEIAERSGLPRSAVTGILSGSLQKVTVDRVLRLLSGVGLQAEIRIKRSA